MTSEPVRIGEILPFVMADIQRRRYSHRNGVLVALKAYNERRSRKQGYHKANQGKRMHYGASQGLL